MSASRDGNTEPAGRIVRLSEALSNQIAAGEVVARPASVVKELLENSLDAGARDITICVDGGGTQRIEVVDDGAGMHPDEAPLALERHATSKLRALSDLDTIATFGFRGEALPSIASVSRLRLRTRRAADPLGCELIVQGGSAPECTPAGGAPGTTITIEELFYNVPARRKFLRTVSTEAAHVTACVLEAALAHHTVTFRLVRDGRQSRQWLRAPSQRERVEDALRPTKLETFSGERGPAKITAYLSTPESARAGTGALHLFVNGRPIRDRALSRAITTAYGDSLERGRFPVGAVFVEIDPELVDVNVHPQKSEVRFRHARAITEAVHSVVAEGAAVAYGISTESKRQTQQWFSGGARGTHAPNDITRRSSEEQLARWRAAAERDRTAVRDRRPELGNWTAPSPSPPPASCEQPVGFRRQEVASTGTPTEPGASASTEFPTGKLLLLAETHTRYLVCEDPSGLRVVDVHRATCVLVRDALRRGIERGGVRAQRLLFPVMVEATESACDALETNTITAVLGFDARRAGPTSVAIHSMPHPLAGRAPEPLIRIVIDAVTRDRKDWIALSDALSATVLSSAEQNASAAFTTEAPAAVIARLERLGEAAVQEATVATIPWSELERRSRR